MYIGRYLRSGSLIPDNFHEVLLKQAQNEGEIEKIEEVLAQNPSWRKHLEDVDKELTKDEQSDNEDELLTLSHQMFLAGIDSKYIDYNLIDNNE